MGINEKTALIYYCVSTDAARGKRNLTEISGKRMRELYRAARL
jgi:hypothetical protein